MRAVTFYELSEALAPLHQWRRADVSRLHDVWKLGAWTPDTVVLTRTFDERAPLKPEQGVVRRIVLVEPLAQWIVETARARGIGVSLEAARLIASGRGLEVGGITQSERVL